MISFNLLLSTNRNYEKNAELEIWFYLFVMGDEDPIIIRSPIDGLLLVNTVLDQFDAINGMRKLFKNIQEPPKFIMKLVPIEYVIETNLDHLEVSIKELLKKRKKTTNKGTYCIQIKKRSTNLRSEEIISQIAQIVENPVNLKKPDWIIRIEIIGNITGLSILKQSDILSLKRA
jgi:tRNA acetyltransferase TAN1